MSVNGVNKNSYYYKTYESAAAKDNKKAKNDKSDSKDAAAVYESSDNKSGSVSKSNAAIIAQMKKDSQVKINQMQSLVQNMFKEQGIKIGSANDMWKMLASGKFTADPQTIAQAKEDISEDGYWGVSQTSDRIFSFAMALAGGDEKKMEEMKAAVEKGFKLATKSWGQELPSISSDTYDTVMGKFDDWFNANGTEK